MSNILIHKLYQITSDYFCVGILVDSHNCVCFTPPIVKWMMDLHINYIKHYCNKKNWKLQFVGKVLG